MTSPPPARPHLQALANLMSARAGLSLSSTRRSNLERSAQRVMRRFHLATPDALIEAVRDRDPVFLDLVSEITVGETYFFREPGHFHFLREVVLPELLRLRGPTTAIRAWSAGCASGEEAYSLAALFAELGLLPLARVEATDISQAALAKARAASYGPWSLRGSGADAMAPWLKRESGRYTVDPRLRRRVDISLLNLADERWPASHGAFDIVMCRNVLIYLDAPAILQVARNLGASLLPGGVLFTGPSDPLIGDDASLETLITSAGIVYRKPASGRAAAPVAAPTAKAGTAAWTDSIATGQAGTETSAPRIDPIPVPPTLSDAPRAWTDAPAAARAELDVDLVAIEKEVRRLSGIGAVPEAVALIDGALKRQPACVELHFQSAMLQLSAQAFASAERELRRIIYLDRSLAVAHFALGTLLLRTARPDAALRAFRNALALARSRPPLETLRLGGGETAERLVRAAAAQVSALGDGGAS